MSVLFSSKTCEWRTPQHLFDRLNEEFNFGLDAAASDWNHMCDRYYTIEDDCLKQNWLQDSMGKPIWLNPPYGRNIVDFIEKAFDECCKGAIVVLLLPARTDTYWFHKYIWNHDKHKTHAWVQRLEFLPGRLKFESREGSKNSAPFGSMIVVFNSNL